jgi:hypothetical protein
VCKKGIAFCREANYLRRVIKVLLNTVFGFDSLGYKLASCFLDCFSKNLACNLVASNAIA